MRKGARARPRLAEKEALSWAEAVSLGLGLAALWTAGLYFSHTPSYLLPSPWEIAKAFYTYRGILGFHFLVTAFEAVVGFLCASTFAFGSSVALSLLRPLRRRILPLLILSQSLPSLAVAPLLNAWFGFGLSAKVILIVFVSYFPMALSFTLGLMQTPRQWLLAGWARRAAPWRIFWFIRLPAAQPHFGLGLRIAAPYAFISALVGEWSGATAGLGFLLTTAAAQLQTPLVFAILILLSTATLGSTKALNAFLRRFFPYAAAGGLRKGFL